MKRYRTIESGGHRVVQVPIDAYNKLIHDAEMFEDIRDFDEAMHDDEASYPSALVLEMVGATHMGERVRAFRQYKGLSQEALGKKIGCSRNFICQIEAGEREGSVSTLKGLAQALEVDIDMLVV